MRVEIEVFPSRKFSLGTIKLINRNTSDGRHRDVRRGGKGSRGARDSA